MIQALGKITVPTPGTPVQVTINLPDEGNPAIPPYTRCHGILVQALPTNGGNVYVGTSAMDAVALSGVFAILGVPTANFLPTFSAALTITPNGLMASDFYLDADVNDEGAIVTILVT
jgi:hypothetical protein